MTIRRENASLRIRPINSYILLVCRIPENPALLLDAEPNPGPFWRFFLVMDGGDMLS